eukprot:Protomagalhaensia_wolfi_Nauph_80__4419@NODE_4525_length_554_cov_6_324272_g3625_i0_p2_GENE_NODE_4525_length_554_cov_6_324272_g3625_i0NODE_4525_length_554_cov_6_324272_g3625_i0_p2_ORF_typecomplete_len136_score26_62_NODE_4525_length_554_cov_6_324272_g3625_i081488
MTDAAPAISVEQFSTMLKTLLDGIKPTNVAEYDLEKVISWFSGLGKISQKLAIQEGVNATVGGPFGFSKKCAGSKKDKPLSELFPTLQPVEWRVFCGVLVLCGSHRDGLLAEECWPFTDGNRGIALYKYLNPKFE